MSYTDKNDYVPKFRVGDVVVFRSWSGDAQTVTITERRVTRTLKRCDTYYCFGNGDGAWEWALDPTTYRRLPGDWSDHLSGRHGHDNGWTTTLTVTPSAFLAEVMIQTPKGHAYVSTALLPDGHVECISWHNVNITLSGGATEVSTYDNLGSAMVAVSNALR